jgi:hypothetical protein
MKNDGCEYEAYCIGVETFMQYAFCLLHLNDWLIS